jgi:hypothetical protein
MIQVWSISPVFPLPEGFFKPVRITAMGAPSIKDAPCHTTTPF